MQHETKSDSSMQLEPVSRDMEISRIKHLEAGFLGARRWTWRNYFWSLKRNKKQAGRNGTSQQHTCRVFCSMSVCDLRLNLVNLSLLKNRPRQALYLRCPTRTEPTKQRFPELDSGAFSLLLFLKRVNAQMEDLHFLTLLAVVFCHREKRWCTAIPIPEHVCWLKTSSSWRKRAHCQRVSISW